LSLLANKFEKILHKTNFEYISNIKLYRNILHIIHRHGFYIFQEYNPFTINPLSRLWGWVCGRGLSSKYRYAESRNFYIYIYIFFIFKYVYTYIIYRIGKCRKSLVHNYLIDLKSKHDNFPLDTYTGTKKYRHIANNLFTTTRNIIPYHKE